MHTLWMREHNRLARSISYRRPELSDEHVYQEARRYLTAEWQKIIYDEFVPIVVGPEQVRQSVSFLDAAFTNADVNVE